MSLKSPVALKIQGYLGMVLGLKSLAPQDIFYLVRPGNLASLVKRSIITMCVHLAEMMKEIFVSFSIYWRKQYIIDSN